MHGPNASTATRSFSGLTGDPTRMKMRSDDVSRLPRSGEPSTP